MLGQNAGNYQKVVVVSRVMSERASEDVGVWVLSGSGDIEDILWFDSQPMCLDSLVTDSIYRKQVRYDSLQFLSGA